jgi:15-cis-phytoene synthase
VNQQDNRGEGPRISSRNFGFAARLLSPATRHDAAALYAFCRHVDDLADEASDRAAAASELERVLASLECGVPGDEHTATVLDLAARFPGLLDSARELMTGVIGDLEPVRIPDDAALRLYCHRVAGTVGEMMCSVLGASAPEARPRAELLGAAMQMTNIARDVVEDARRGRVYLPACRLGGLGPEEVLQPDAAARKRIIAVVAWLLGEAEAAYAAASQGLRYLGLRNRFATAVALSVYRDIGREIVRRQFPVWQERVSLSTRRRVRLALATVLPTLLGVPGDVTSTLDPWLTWPPLGPTSH